MGSDDVYKIIFEIESKMRNVKATVADLKNTGKTLKTQEQKYRKEIQQTERAMKASVATQNQTKPTKDIHGLEKKAQKTINTAQTTSAANRQKIFANDLKRNKAAYNETCKKIDANNKTIVSQSKLATSIQNEAKDLRIRAKQLVNVEHGVKTLNNEEARAQKQMMYSGTTDSLFKQATAYKGLSIQATKSNKILQNSGMQFRNVGGEMKLQRVEMVRAAKYSRKFKETIHDATKAEASMVKQKLAPHMNKINKRAGVAKDTFNMWALSVMFGGMMIQKTFQSILQKSMGVFMSMSQGQNTMAGSVLQLQAAWQVLSFTIGSSIATVIDSLLPKLLPIIEAFIEWTSAHKKLTGWLVIGGLVFGAFLMLAGQFILLAGGIAGAFNAIINAITTMHAALTVTKLKTYGIAIAGIIKQAGLLVKKLSIAVVNALKKAAVKFWAYTTSSTAAAISTAAFVASVLLLAFVLFALKGKFGTWANALKAFVSAFVLSIAAIIGGVTDIITAPLALAAKGLKLLLKGYNAWARASNKPTIGKGIIKALDEVDDLGQVTKAALEETSILLDKVGFNPEPVTESNNMWEDFLKGMGVPTGEDINNALPSVVTENEGMPIYTPIPSSESTVVNTVPVEQRIIINVDGKEAIDKEVSNQIGTINTTVDNYEINPGALI